MDQGRAAFRSLREGLPAPGMLAPGMKGTAMSTACGAIESWDEPLMARCHGHGSPLLLLHVPTGSGAELEPILYALAKRYRVIVPDITSRTAQLPGRFQMARITCELRQLLHDMRLPSVDVLGYELGGTFAQQFARDYPSNVHRLILVSTYANETLPITTRLATTLLDLFGWVCPSPRFAARLDCEPRMAHQPGAHARWLHNRIHWGTSVPMDAASGSLARFDSRPWLARIACPTLVITGGADPLVPLAQAQLLASHIPNATLRILNTAGHGLFSTHRDQIVWLTQEFLATQSYIPGSGNTA